jgi:hypothetical protein
MWRTSRRSEVVQSHIITLLRRKGSKKVNAKMLRATYRDDSSGWLPIGGLGCIVIVKQLLSANGWEMSVDMVRISM